MKRNLLNVNDAVEIKIDGGIDNGIITDMGIFSATVMVGNDETDELDVVAIPYKDIVSIG